MRCKNYDISCDKSNTICPCLMYEEDDDLIEIKNEIKEHDIEVIENTFNKLEKEYCERCSSVYACPSRDKCILIGCINKIKEEIKEETKEK